MQVTVPRPDVRGRTEILKWYLNKIKFDKCEFNSLILTLLFLENEYISSHSVCGPYLVYASDQLIFSSSLYPFIYAFFSLCISLIVFYS